MISCSNNASRRKTLCYAFVGHSVEENARLDLGREPNPEGERHAMPELSPELRTLQARIAAHESWARTPDPTARTANARQAFEDKFLDQAGGDPVKAEHLRRAHYLRMALASAKARRRRGGRDDAA
jgi:hypothetical protein